MSLPVSYFDAMWADEPNPWGLQGRWYEERKRAVLLACLPTPRFERVLEVGCAAGLLTTRLAARSDLVVAVDASSVACQRTRAATERMAVDVQHLAVPGEWPSPVGTEYDLVVVSEVAYYLDAGDLARLATRCRDAMAADGVLVSCHWRHAAPGYPSTGDEAQRGLVGEDLDVLVHHEEEDFVLDVVARSGHGSVARRTGLVP